MPHKTIGFCMSLLLVVFCELFKSVIISAYCLFLSCYLLFIVFLGFGKKVVYDKQHTKPVARNK